MKMTERPPTEIKGLSEIRRLPRLGKIRLGIKAVSKQSGKEHPKETDYFVVPPEVAKVYGEQPKLLDIMFPVEDRAIIAPQAYEFYGQAKGLKCTGNGEYALELNEATGAMERRECPCERLDKKQCSQRMHLRVVLPKVNLGGIYQIDTSSFNSIVNINSAIQYLRCATASSQYPHGRITWLPIRLYREATETHHNGQKQIHYPLKMDLKEALRGRPQLESPGTVALPPPDPDAEVVDNDLGYVDLLQVCPQELVEAIRKGFTELKLSEETMGKVLASYDVSQVEDLTPQQANIVLANLRKEYKDRVMEGGKQA